MDSCITKLFVPILLVLSAAAQAAGAAAPGHTLVVLGDSLSAGFGLAPGEGWVTLLERRLMAEGYGYQVVNASISGDTTGGALRRLPRVLAQHHPEVVLVELGGNDGLRGTPIEVIRRNLSDIVRLAKTSGARVVLASMRIPPNYGERYTSEFAGLYEQVATENKVPLAGFLLDGVALDRALMQADGIHPNVNGQPKLLENAWPVLKPVLKVAAARPAKRDGVRAATPPAGTSQPGAGLTAPDRASVQQGPSASRRAPAPDR
jgi:acyl-CoA thioesterase-1